MRGFRSIALVGGFALAIVGFGSTLASADPTSTPVPTCAVSAVGSDTLTPLANQWQGDYSPTGTNCGFDTWDATGSATIQEKGTASADPNCAVNRPNGSSKGIADLALNNKTHDGFYCASLARASRDLTTAEAATLSTKVPALDMITWSANSGGHAPASLTDAQLVSIFTANTGSCPTWSSLGAGTSTDTIVPVLPQNGSGTRSSWLTELGITTIGTCVTNRDGSQAIEENEGTNAVFGGTTANDVIYPYSIGADICQTARTPEPTACTTQAPGNLTLRQIDAAAPTCVLSGGETVENLNGFSTCATTFPTSYIRNLNLAYRTADTDPSLAAFLTWACTNTTAQSDVDKFGFVPNGTNC